MDRDVVGLLGMIRDITHNHDETKLGLMAIIESDMELYLVFGGQMNRVIITWPYSRPGLIPSMLTKVWQASILGMSTECLIGFRRSESP